MAHSRYIPNNWLAKLCRARQGNLVGVLTRSYPRPSLAAMAQKGTFHLFFRREQNTNLIKLILLLHSTTTAGASGAKFRVTSALPTGAVLNCADNSGAKTLYIIEPFRSGSHLNRLPSASVGEMVVASVKKGKPELRKKSEWFISLSTTMATTMVVVSAT